MILDKAKMAHDWYMKHSESPSFMDTEIKMAWQYADAMQAEADKREPSGFPNVLRGACGEIVAVKVDDKEWQPDWSQAPEWAEYFAVNGDNTGAWMRSIDKPPYAGDPYDQWFCYGRLYRNEKAPSFNYQGNWQDSLRKRL